MPKKVKRKKGRVIWGIYNIEYKSWEYTSVPKLAKDCNEYRLKGEKVWDVVKFVECLTD